MSDIPEAVRQQGMHPFLAMKPPSSWKRVDSPLCFVLLHPMGVPQVVEPGPELTPETVGAAVAEARKIVRDHGAPMLVWLTTSDHPWLGPALAAQGLVNEDSPGFENIENVMALLSAPTRGTESGSADGVEIRLVDTFEDFVAGKNVEQVAFDMPLDLVAKEVAEYPQRWDEYLTDECYVRWNALVDGQTVGTATAMLGPVGINLFGGAVLESARGRGCYRALVSARWDYAVERGTPALTVQAGRMSMPILESLGFQLVEAMIVYVDKL